MRLLPSMLLLGLLQSCIFHVARSRHHPTYDEVEPNDSALAAPFYGGLRPGDGFTVRGQVQAFGFDLYDGAALRADAPIELEFDLESHAHGTDLDVCVYDPDLERFVVCADSPTDPEHGSVIVLEPGKVLHLVVTSAYGDAPYSLRVRAHATNPSIAPLQSEGPVGDPRKAAHRANYHTERPAQLERVIEARVYDLDTGASRVVRAVRRGGELVLLGGHEAP